MGLFRRRIKEVIGEDCDAVEHKAEQEAVSERLTKVQGTLNKVNTELEEIKTQADE